MRHIPDRVRLVRTSDGKMRVFNDETSTESEPLQVASFTLHWDELDGLQLTVEYGSRIRAINAGTLPSLTVFYDAFHVRLV